MASTFPYYILGRELEGELRVETVTKDDAEKFIKSLVMNKATWLVPLSQFPNRPVVFYRGEVNGSSVIEGHTAVIPGNELWVLDWAKGDDMINGPYDSIDEFFSENLETVDPGWEIVKTEYGAYIQGESPIFVFGS